MPPCKNLLAIARHVIAVSCEDELLVFFIPLRFVSPAFLVFLAPTLTRARDIALSMPYVICVFPLPQLVSIASEIRFFLLVKFRPILLAISLQPGSDFCGVA